MWEHGKHFWFDSKLNGLFFFTFDTHAQEFQKQKGDPKSGSERKSKLANGD
jgi:hypothetical protein